MKNIKYLTMPFEVKAVKEENGIGIIDGYAAAFNNVDFGFDLIDKGAFTKTLMENGKTVPILADHDPYKPIGYNLEASEDDYGLKVKGEINLDTQLGKERYSLAKQAQRVGAKMGLSIGYTTIKSEPDSQNPIIRRLKELRLWEYSFVTFPMNDKAMVTAAKNLAGLDRLNFAVNHLKEMGFTLKDLELALQLNMEAAQKDPSNASQSWKNALDTFDLK